MRILIVDDSGFARKMIRSSAKTVFPDAEFIPAGNGMDAYTKYVEQSNGDAKPDIVLLDHLMPGIDGLETMEKILEFDRSAFIVFVSANIQDPIRNKALESGARLFLNKPLKPGDFDNIKNSWEASQP